VSAGLTDVGKKRDHNEDSFLIDEDLKLFVVADGMGGHAGGGTASRIAVETIDRELRQARSTQGSALEAKTALQDSPVPEAIRAAVERACIAIYSKAQEDPRLAGMGTTVISLLLKDEQAFFAHVGDSRAYLVRGDECAQLTADHSRVGEMVRLHLLSPDEAAHHPARSQLTRSLGSGPGVQVDLTRQPIEAGDVLVLCTDGLWDLVARAEMADAFATSDHPTSASALTDAIVDLAIKRGASDNVTAAVIVITSSLPFPAAAGRRLFRRGRS